ncbi:TIGR01212 family radical SAM protein, partial [Clostridium sp. HCS.1]
GTKMVEKYESGELKLLTQEQYIDLVCKCIARITEEMVVHRLTGDAPRDLLIGPMWSIKKWEVLNAIDKALEDNDIWQGKDFK